MKNEDILSWTSALHYIAYSLPYEINTLLTLADKLNNTNDTDEKASIIGRIESQRHYIARLLERGIEKCDGDSH